MSFRKMFKKDKNDEYKRAFDDLNREESLKTAKDRIFFEQVTSGDEGAYLARKLLDGTPLVLNFELLDIDQGNMLLAFLSGVLFTCDGEVVKLNEKSYLFARKQDFIDGSLKSFLEEVWQD